MIKIIENEFVTIIDLIKDVTQKLILFAQIQIHNHGLASPYFFTEAIQDVDSLVLTLQYLLSTNKLIKIIIE